MFSQKLFFIGRLREIQIGAFLHRHQIPCASIQNKCGPGKFGISEYDVKGIIIRGSVPPLSVESITTRIAGRLYSTL